jgi:hypothetical protein
MPNENAEQQANVEKITTEEETLLQEKAKRSRDDVKKVFMETYGFEEDDTRLEKLVDRELAHSKVVSKLIGQKIHWREKAGSEKKEIAGNEPANDIRTIERQKAVDKVLTDISKKFSDLDTTQVYEKIKEVYKEKGDETLRGDFEKKLWQSFWLSHPDKYKENMREKLSKEADYSDNRATSKPLQTKKQTERKFFVKQTSPKDWFAKKS